MKMRSRVMEMALLGAAAMALACGTNAVAGTDDDSSTISGDVPAVFQKFTNGVEISADGSEIVLRSRGVPNHRSPYWSPGDSRFEAYNGSNPQWASNGFTIQEQQLVIRIPRNPQKAASASPTPLGPIGMALNGVPIFNQYAGNGRPLTMEINSFDQYNGHPQQTGSYHYHAEPLYLTRTGGSEGLIGFLLDGFPVYGPVENGKTLANADLDDLHGHTGPTADYPNGIYHYHATAEAPYINGAGFYGTPGTASR
ncbi:MAG TPA: YHYH protein [Longimicrobium sp.]